MLYVHFSQFINHKILPLFLINFNLFLLGTHTHTHTHTHVFMPIIYCPYMLPKVACSAEAKGKRQSIVISTYTWDISFSWVFLYTVMGGLQMLGLCADMQRAAYRPPLFPNVYAHCLYSLYHPRLDARYPGLI